MKVNHEMQQELLMDVELYKDKEDYCNLMGEYFLDHCKMSFLDCCKKGPQSQSTTWRYGDINAIASQETLRRMRCRTGYKRDPNTASCEDLNECAFTPCDPGHACINTIGSYRCQRVTTCGTGYFLNKTNHCVDIDECSQVSTFCPANTKCINKPGTYKCEPVQCKKGYATDAAGNCKDIDECEKGTHECPEDSQCENQAGGFTCRCKKGFRYNTRLNVCKDIDECRERLHDCDRSTHICRNRKGTFVCMKKKLRCRTGLRWGFFRESFFSKKKKFFLKIIF